MVSTVTQADVSPLVAALEENLHRHLAYVQRRVAGMTVVDRPDLLLIDSGLPSDTFNQIARARLDPTGAGQRIAAAIDHFRAAGRPYSWWVGPGSRPLDLQPRLAAAGLRLEETEVAMAAALDDLPPGIDTPAGLDVRRVESATDLAGFAAAVAANWSPPDAAVDAFYRLAAPVLLGRAQCPLRLYAGYLDGQAVAGCEVFAAAGVAGVYSVVTRERFRRRGIGTAVTWTALDAARRAGARTATLQASEAGRRVYLRLGFRECARFAEYH
jgi:GNAT superfamily N-acetyltransferase